jgi:hypothetical protein
MTIRRIFKEHWALAFIVLIGVLLRLIFASAPRVVRWDEASYVLIGRNLLAGQGYRELIGAADLQQPPLVAYISLVGLWLHLPLAWAAAGIAHVLLGGLLPLPVYGLARELYGRRVGLIAALLTAIYPALVVSPLYWSTMTEPPYALFVMSGVYGTWRWLGQETGHSTGASGRLGQETGHSTGASGRLGQETGHSGWQWGLRNVLFRGWIGAAFGLAYLTRPEALAYLLLMVVYLVACRWWAGRAAGGTSSLEGRGVGADQDPIWIRAFRRFFKTALLPALAAVFVFLSLAVPYVIYLHRVTGHWAFSGKQGISIGIAWAYVNRSQAMHDQAVASLDSAGREIMWLSPEQFDRGLAGWIAENPRRFIRQVLQNVVDTWQALFHQDLFNPWMLAVIALGLFARPWTRRRARGELLLLLALVPLASTWAFFVLSRFLIIVIPIGLIWAAAGLDHLATWVETSSRNLFCAGPVAGVASCRELRATTGRALPLALTIVALLWVGAGVVRREQPAQPWWRVEAAHWLAGHVPPGSPIMTRDSEIPLYAGLPMVAFPNADWPRARAYGLERGAAYLVVDDREIRDIRPQLAPLLDAENPQPLPGLTPIARLSYPSRTTLIYKLTQEP